MASHTGAGLLIAVLLASNVLSLVSAAGAPAPATEGDANKTEDDHADSHFVPQNGFSELRRVVHTPDNKQRAFTSTLDNNMLALWS